MRRTGNVSPAPDSPKTTGDLHIKLKKLHGNLVKDSEVINTRDMKEAIAALVEVNKFLSANSNMSFADLKMEPPKISLTSYQDSDLRNLVEWKNQFMQHEVVKGVVEQDRKREAEEQRRQDAYKQAQLERAKREEDEKRERREAARLREEEEKKRIDEQNAKAAAAIRERELQQNKEILDAKMAQLAQEAAKAKVVDEKKLSEMKKELDVLPVFKQAQALYESKYMGPKKSYQPHFIAGVKLLSDPHLKDHDADAKHNRFQKQVIILLDTFIVQRVKNSDYLREYKNSSKGLFGGIKKRFKKEVLANFQEELNRLKKGSHYSRMLGKILLEIAKRYDDSVLGEGMRQKILNEVGNLKFKNAKVNFDYAFDMSKMEVDKPAVESEATPRRRMSSDGGS
jgi:flagellar biosynthesis GTPase FlhF